MIPPATNNKNNNKCKDNSNNNNKTATNNNGATVTVTVTVNVTVTATATISKITSFCLYKKSIHFRKLKMRDPTDCEIGNRNWAPRLSYSKLFLGYHHNYVGVGEVPSSQINYIKMCIELSNRILIFNIHIFNWYLDLLFN